MNDFTPIELKILNAVQRSIPLDSRPFFNIARDAGVGEDEVITILRGLKNRGIIRNIAGIFNGENLGYFLSLVALRLNNENLEEAARFISSHPGVSHNYGRDHDYNLWFTLACESREGLEKTVRLIAEKTKAYDSLIFRNEKLYKIGVILPLGDEKKPQESKKEDLSSFSMNSELTGIEREAVKYLQTDLPLVREPFRKILEESETNVTENELLQAGRSLLAKKIMRRYSAVLRHTKAGFSHNAMTAWKIPPDFDTEKKYECFVNSPAVTHLYMRTVFPGRWEYPLFAMIHAKSESELEETISGLSAGSGIEDYTVLKTLKEYKKQRVIYFSAEFTKWEKENND